MAMQAAEGTRDFLPDEAAFWLHFKETAFSVFGRYGYVPIETPIFEQTDLFVRGIGEATDVVSKEMFTAVSGENLKRLIDGGTIKSKSRLSLRPEGTAGVVRAVADGLYTRRLPHLVLDPVMIAKSGDALLADDAIALLLEAIFRCTRGCSSS